MKSDSVTAAAPTNDLTRGRFRLIQLLYVVTLLGAAFAIFGEGGGVAAMLVLIAWSYVFASGSRALAVQRVLLIGASVMPVVLFLVVAYVTSCGIEGPRRYQCYNNLKNIALALHNYHERYRSFPPAYVANEEGTPLHSWRVLVLPFLDEQALYSAYSFDEPWDGPRNSKLASRIPHVYRCPSHQPRDGCTGYVAVVGKETVWTGQHGVRLEDVTDGTCNTLLIMECDARDVNWMEPRDLSYDDALRDFGAGEFSPSSPHYNEDFFYRHHSGRSVALADASVESIADGLSHRSASAFLQRNDESQFDLFDGFKSGGTQLRVGNCFRLGLLICIVLLPLPWVWTKPHGSEHG